MGDLLKSLSARFYLSLICALVAVGTVLSWRGVLAVLGTSLASTFVIVFGLIPIFFLVLGLFYRVFGLVWRTPPWRGTVESGRFERTVPITYPSRGEQPYWTQGSRSPNAGTLRDFIRQHLAPKEVDDTEFRIGIVLAGGGAKGVYQAGALRALLEFLERERALEYVRAVAGTSIGSWNAMFWLTRQIADNGLGDWWASAVPSKIVGPTFYVPILRNYILHNQPWRAQFADIFQKRADPVLRGGPPFFYFTRTNVGQARLEFTTNHLPSDVHWGTTTQGYKPLGPIIDEPKGYHRVTDFEDLRQSVFASMDIPPAFRRLRGSGGEEWEDGGVADNLPIRFLTWFEGCNLLFVLPLNASFEATPSDRSILLRMFRVMDIRQGVLEQGAIRDISLYNAIIDAHQNIDRNMHVKPVTTFCICPEPPLDIGTFEFWKMKHLGPEAYTLMYEATCAELDRFDFTVTNHEVWMGRVRRNGEVVYKDFTLR